jgi:hypothetical protein
MTTSQLANLRSTNARSCSEESRHLKWDPERRPSPNTSRPCPRVTFSPTSNQMDTKRTEEIRLPRKTVLTITCIVLALFPAYGQDNRKNEIGLLLGGTFTPALDIAGPGANRLEIGSGITFQLTYARQLTAARSIALYFEVPALAILLQDITSSNGSIPRNYDSFFVTPGLRVKLAPSQHVSPWLSAGGGYALFDESANRMDGTHNTTRGTSGGALQFGGGVDIRTPIKVLFPIGLRAEVRDLYTAKPNYNVSTGGGFQHNVALSGGIVLDF